MSLFVDFFVSWSSLIGLALVVLTGYDVAVTVLAVSSGPGPITRRVSRATWWVCRGANRRLGWSPFLRAAGPLIILLVLWTWLVLMIVGWGLVFGQEGSLLENGEALQPAFGRIHYAASLVLGRGGSSFEPAAGVWRFAEQLASLVGVAFVGMAVAYVLPVVGAVIHKRQVAVSIWSLGASPVEILSRAWNGRDFGDLDLHLLALTPELARLSQQHFAYPVLAYFHSADRDTALAPSIVVLDETLMLFESAIEGDVGLEASAWAPCRATVSLFLKSVEAMDVHAPYHESLPVPDLDALRAIGVPLRDEASIGFAYAAAASVDRRSLLADYLAYSGSSLDEVRDPVHGHQDVAVPGEDPGSGDDDGPDEQADLGEEGRDEHDEAS